MHLMHCDLCISDSKSDFKSIDTFKDVSNKECSSIYGIILLFCCYASVFSVQVEHDKHLLAWGSVKMSYVFSLWGAYIHAFTLVNMAT